MEPKLKFLDRYLTLWIFIAMGLGILLGYIFPGIKGVYDVLSIGKTNIPIALGLLFMLYPSMAKVNFSLLPKVLKDKKTLTLSLILNWIVGPVLMFDLAIIFLKDKPDYMIGLILIGLARCIAMVMVWNDLARGNREYAAVLVAINSIFQVFTYSLYAWIFIRFLPDLLGLGLYPVDVPFGELTKSVFIYLGMPLLAGFLTRHFLVKQYGEDWYIRKFTTKLSSLAMFALLFTITLMFSLTGDTILEFPYIVLRITIPLIAYLLVIFFISFLLAKALGISYDKNAALSLTAAGNNFELAIVVSIAVFGINSPQAFVGIVGPLVEVPLLILFVKICKKLAYKTKPINA